MEKKNSTLNEFRVVHTHRLFSGFNGFKANKIKKLHKQNEYTRTILYVLHVCKQCSNIKKNDYLELDLSSIVDTKLIFLFYE